MDRKIFLISGSVLCRDGMLAWRIAGTISAASNVLSHWIGQSRELGKGSPCWSVLITTYGSSLWDSWELCQLCCWCSSEEPLRGMSSLEWIWPLGSASFHPTSCSFPAFPLAWLCQQPPAKGFCDGWTMFVFPRHRTGLKRPLKNIMPEYLYTFLQIL